MEKLPKRIGRLTNLLSEGGFKMVEDGEKTVLEWEDPEENLPEPFREVLVKLEGGEIIDAFLQRPRNDLPHEWHDYGGEIMKKVKRWTPQPHLEN